MPSGLNSSSRAKSSASRPAFLVIMAGENIGVVAVVIEPRARRVGHRLAQHERRRIGAFVHPTDRFVGSVGILIPCQTGCHVEHVLNRHRFLGVIDVRNMLSANRSTIGWSTLSSRPSFTSIAVSVPMKLFVTDRKSWRMFGA